MRKKTIGFIGEFKEFLSRGNVIDMAVGIIMGNAFTKIVTSLVNELVMPAIGYLIGGVDFAQFKVVLVAATADTPETAILYGSFIQNIVNFLIIAMVVFMMVKLINTFRRKQQTEPEVAAESSEPEPSREEILLGEIRDLLKR